MGWRRRQAESPPQVYVNTQTLNAGEKATDVSTSVQARFHTDVDTAYGLIMGFSQALDDFPVYGSRDRDRRLREIWHIEPLLAGAVSSMTQKLGALNWQISGKRNAVSRYSNILYNVEDGAGWGNFLPKGVQDYLTTDNGWFMELGRAYPGGPVVDLFHMDSGAMTVTGNRNYPYFYTDRTNGRIYRCPRDDVVRLVSMPSPIESDLGRGFCAVSRCVKAAKLLVALHEYDAEKLSNMPPQGIAAVTGLTGRQVQEAIKMYKEARAQRDQATFPGVLWLASATTDVAVNMVPFSTLPDNFSKEVVITLYVYTLALAFGVDAREFWPATVTGATKGDALIQAQKAKGKGPGELISAIERAINFYVLGQDVTFEFDFSDDEEDRLSAEIEGLRVTNAKTLIDSGILQPEQALAWLVSQRVLPEEFAIPVVQTSRDVEGHKRLDEDLVTIWQKNGHLEGPFARLPYGFKTAGSNGHSKELVRV